jgi:hypothetical protein
MGFAATRAEARQLVSHKAVNPSTLKSSTLPPINARPAT